MGGEEDLAFTADVEAKVRVEASEPYGTRFIDRGPFRTCDGLAACGEAWS